MYSHIELNISVFSSSSILMIDLTPHLSVSSGEIEIKSRTIWQKKLILSFDYHFLNISVGIYFMLGVNFRKFIGTQHYKYDLLFYFRQQPKTPVKKKLTEERTLASSIPAHNQHNIHTAPLSQQVLFHFSTISII